MTGPARPGFRKWYRDVGPDDAPVRPSRAVEEAHLLLRRTRRVLQRVAEEDGWPTPCSPLRYLVLARLRQRRGLHLRPRRLARLLDVPRSTLAHHLNVLEASDLVRRTRGAPLPAEIGDGRRVAVELTEEGNVVLWRLSSALEEEGIPERVGEPDR